MRNASIPTGEPQWSALWTELLRQLGQINEGLLTELERCRDDLRDILEGQLLELETIELPAPEDSSVAVYRSARAELGRKVFAAALTKWDRKRPYKQALKAIESYDRKLEDLAESLPESVRLNGPQAIEGLGQSLVPQGWPQRFARFRRKEFALPLAALVTDELRRWHRGRAKAEGQFLLTQAQGIRQLHEIWEQSRDLLDSSFHHSAFSAADAEALRVRIKNSLEMLARQADAALLEWRKWTDGAHFQLARRILKSVILRRPVKALDDEERRAVLVAHQVRQLRAVEAELKLEQALEQSEDRILSRAVNALENLSLERANLLAELEHFIGWLQSAGSDKQRTPAPLPSTDVVPAASRLAEFESGLKAAIKSLPSSVKILDRFSALPKRRIKTKEFKPAETLLGSFARTGRARIVSLLEDIEEAHHKVVQDIEQARDVVSFSMEAVGDEQSPSLEVIGEGLQNALSLLEFSRAEVPDWRADADTQLTQTLAAVFIEERLMLSRNRLGEFAYLARQGFGRAVLLGSRTALAAAGRSLTGTQRAAGKLALRFLVYIGWRSAPTTGKVEVVTRPFLPQEYATDLIAKELPAIYRRLFRFEPVQDFRFLVGRDIEMEAIAQARDFWEAGRPVALIIVGERGSGKTSLINCALKRSLEDLEVIRGEFIERLTTAAQMRSVLARMFSIEDPADLEKFLTGQRRVVIIEELERAFLRQVGHFESIRALQRLIAATCNQTLWILITNQVAYKFLDASVGLGQSFSHRINAASVRSDDLREAVLLRHNLSGLRLQFALPPEQSGLFHRWTGRLRGEADPEKIFFDTLAKESAGVFRTAFNIWLSEIESVEAGVLYMKTLVPPDLTPVIDDLKLADLFTLVAIMQHGSLTPEEHATVFQKSRAASRAQIDELLAREIVEQDPGRSGYRVRPEALRVVREALYRRNLL